MNKTLAIATVLAVVVLLTSSTTWAAEGKVELKLRLQEGREYKLLMTMQQEIVQWVFGNEQEIHQTIGIGLTFTVKDVDDEGTMTVEGTFGPIQMKREEPVGMFEYDSENPPDEIPAPAIGMAALVDQSFTMKLTAEGKVRELTDVDAMFNTALEDLEQPMRDKIVEDMRRLFGEDGFKPIMESVTAIFPGKPVGVGDVWTQKTTMTCVFPMIIETTYTLVGRKDGVATLESESTIESNPDAAPIEMGPVTMKFRLEGSESGTFKIDEATGWYVKGESTQELKGEATMSNIPGQDSEMSIPMRIESRTTFETE